MNPFGNIDTPGPLNNFDPVQSGGLGQFLNLLLNVIVVAGAIYALFNFVLAGYMFFSAADDPKKIEGAWAKIWQTAVGLFLIAGAILLAAVFGWLIFGNPTYILSPSIPTVDTI